MKRKIVIYSGFNRAMLPQVGYNSSGIHNSLTKKWIKPRFEVWKKFTWQSIINQTYTNWVYCICCHPDKSAKAITDELFSCIVDPRFRLVYSETDQETFIMKDISKGFDEIVNVRVDSDDMYHPKAIQELSTVLAQTDSEWFLWRKGYCYQYGDRGKMKTYEPNVSGPFFAKRYSRAEWIQNGIIAIRMQHQKVRKLKPYIMLNNRILVGITGKNTTTLFRYACFKRKIYEPEKTKILKEFKII